MVLSGNTFFVTSYIFRGSSSHFHTSFFIILTFSICEQKVEVFQKTLFFEKYFYFLYLHPLYPYFSLYFTFIRHLYLYSDNFICKKKVETNQKIASFENYFKLSNSMLFCCNKHQCLSLPFLCCNSFVFMLLLY